MNQIELVLEMGQWIGDATVTNVRTDHVRVGQIITNLIANAIVSLGVSLCHYFATTLNLLFVSVEDTGPGLSPSERAVLFQRFSRE
jgi:signal transduction histidine kinase